MPKQTTAGDASAVIVPFDIRCDDSIQEGRCVAFVGAGWPAAAGLPQWRDLIRSVAEDPLPIKDANGLSMVLDFSQLSAGQRNLMALTIDFARRLALTYPGWDNPLEAPGILLIDEIELNLHPKWQQTVIPHLRKVLPDTQMVVATHSPLVLSTLYARQIRILRGQQVVTPSVETYGSASDRVQRQIMETDPGPSRSCGRRTP